MAVKQSNLSPHFGQSAEVELFAAVPKGSRHSTADGLEAIDLQAQNLIADLFYYCLPNMYRILDLTIPGLTPNKSAGEFTDLEIYLKEVRRSNIPDGAITTDIVATLREISALDSNTQIMFMYPGEDDRNPLLLCRIRYVMDSIASPLSRLALKYNRDDENATMRVDLLTHLMERRNGYNQYLPARKLH